LAAVVAAARHPATSLGTRRRGGGAADAAGTAATVEPTIKASKRPAVSAAAPADAPAPVAAARRRPHRPPLAGSVGDHGGGGRAPSFSSDQRFKTPAGVTL